MYKRKRCSLLVNYGQHNETVFPQQPGGIGFDNYTPGGRNMKKTIYEIPNNGDDNSIQYTWPKFIIQVLGIFILLFVMVKIMQTFS
jgi:hypothetical protein